MQKYTVINKYANKYKNFYIYFGFNNIISER
jgi:hypothetical protein